MPTAANPAADGRSRPNRPLPPGARDCHTHVFGPYARFPLAAERSYTPPEAPFEAHLAWPDAGHLLDLLDEWCGDDTLRRKILADNPARLYGHAV